MMSWTNIQNALQGALQNALVLRLVLVSLELLLLALGVSVVIRLFHITTPRFKAMLWLLVLAKPLLGLVLGTPFHLLQFPNPESSIVTPWNINQAGNLDNLIERQMEADKKRLAAHPLPVMPGSAKQESPDPRVARLENASPQPSLSIPFARILTVIWIFGIAFFAAVTVFDYMRIKKLLSQGQTAPDSVQKHFHELAQAMGIKLIPELRLTLALESPALIGIIRPVILIPHWIVRQSDPSRLDWLLRHELMHWKHKDSIALLVRRMSEMLFFFHPAVWWAGTRWEEAMELACDRALLTSEPEAQHYARQLYHLLEAQQHRIRRPLGAGIFATRTQIGKRIAALLANPLKHPARLSAISIICLALITLGAFCFGVGVPGKMKEQKDDIWIAQISNPGEAGGKSPGAVMMKNPSSGDEEINKRVNQVNADLRSLHTALEAYKVDYNDYPVKFPSLTTPIAYLTKIFEDPFIEGGAWMKMAFTPDYKAIYIYSVGPDGIDQKGLVPYDPSNGTLSSGDIMRTIDLQGDTYYRILDPALKAKIMKQKNELQTIASSLEAWYIDKLALPERLEDLTAPVSYLKKIPEDLFSPGRPVSYILDKEAGIALIYSVGPDGRDDDGIRELQGIIPRGTTPEGDIIVKVTLEELKKRYSQKDLSQVSKEDVFLQDLLKIKEQDGKDNALIHYQMASKLMPPVPDAAQSELMKKVQDQGWDASAEPLLPYLKLYKPMFEEIRKGVSLDYAKNVGWEKGPATTVPNFLSAQISSKMLCVEGRYLESLGQYSEALENYLTVVAMGRDFSAPEGTLISFLISIAVDNIGLKQLYQLVKSGNLDVPSLEMALARLKVFEKTQGTIVQGFQGEILCYKWQFQKMLEDPKFRDEYYDELTKQLGQDGIQVKETKEEFPSLIERLEKEYNQFWASQIEYISTPYWKRNPEEYKRKTDEMMESFHPFNKRAIPNFLEADVRYLAMVARMRKVQIATALATYRAKNGRYPADLSALIPEFFDAMPIDPFSGKGFIYQLVSEGTNYTLYSIGPDRMNDERQILYDPTNGTVSSGDISY